MARKHYEFKPDAAVSFLKKLYLTRLQRLNLLKWTLYGLMCVVLLVFQDVTMSRLSIFGSTTDLAPAAIFLITVLVGCDYGPTFALVASTVYWFSGSAPAPYCIALITVLAVLATLVRQSFWRHGFRSTVICAGAGILLYEILLFLVALVLGLAPFSRAGAFLLTGIYSTAVMIPLYPLARKIGQIGGETWKE